MNVTLETYKNIIFIGKLEAEIYINAHAMIINKKEHNVKPEIHNKTNILFIGIDSISRLHLIRAMPLTYNYLREKQWIEMKAYNKIGDNTFPNFMAILAGVNETYAFDKCSTKETGGINKCKLLWDNFKDQKYTTAYAEDSMEISTFNFYKKGFEKQPTDFYFRYFALAAEKYLPTTHDKPWNTNCIGYQHYADYIYNYAFDFASQYKNSPYFGFFWTNSFSHDDINLPSGYDLRMRNHLRKFEEEKVLDNTIVIFVSDHGIRFGDIRNFFTGWLEERMPFLYFYIPENFKKRYPNLIKNLKINRERLTTPFDVYLTMKHVLQLSGSEQDFTAISCPDCQSLFKEISINRTCADAGIPENYCTCSPYEEIDHSLPIVKNIANFIVNVLNALLSSHKKCAQLKLENVISARELTYKKNKDFLVTLSVLPSKGKFEATVRKTSVKNSFELLGDISRINRYGDQSKCIRDAHLRKYCYCI
ncbi:hypothetical protein PVAND_017726 [Polypedilum vanderplanki]|uniref:Uncharacterized protein n=1 Tax=Polypedilum vanderplanki TaxID=319348 RepID=A0A9J6B948_POLVA|nr:hypothetical protein PVAND_017726 [Polypedilum vanderplanki]